MKGLSEASRHLSSENRQKLFHCIKRDISGTMMRYFTEKDSGYRSLHSCGFSDEDIAVIWDRVMLPKVCEANRIMEVSGLAPLFPDPSDSYATSLRYMELTMEEK